MDTHVSSSAVHAPATGVPPARRPFRDNSRLILAGIVILVGVLAAIVSLAERTSRLSPDFLTEVVLYALSATNVTMLLALVFVLARNIVKLLVERRRAMPFAQFRAKLVLTLVGLTLIPALLVLIVGSRVVLTAVDRWFNTPMEEILLSANRIAADYYEERQKVVVDQATRLARLLGTVDMSAADVGPIRRAVTPDVTQQRVGMVQVYRITARPDGQFTVEPLVEVAQPRLPQGLTRAASDRLAARVAADEEPEPWTLEPVSGGGELIRAAVPIRSGPGRLTGVVIASDYLSGDLADRSRRMTLAYEDYTQLRVLKQPLAGVYLSFFVMVTLMILVGSTWMGFYMAKRITRPVQLMSVAAREIGEGHFEHRIQHEAADEFGSMIEAFNTMAAGLAASRRRLERATLDLEQKNEDVDARRRYIETILERVATGVVSIDPAGRIRTANSAALRLLELEAPSILGRPAVDVFKGQDLRQINDVLDRAARAKGESSSQEVAVVRDGREIHLAVVATRLSGSNGAFEGTILVLDDVTPLIRAQKVAAWREVARRLAHEIKNPLTPIQLSAERIKRKLGDLEGAHGELVQECTSTIIGEVESLKGLVDEFSQFARMPAPRATVVDLHRLLGEALTLYDGLFADVCFLRDFAADLPTVRVDPEQIKRVVINLIDNAIEAMDSRGTIIISTSLDAANSLVRLVVADDGPGIPPAEREKLFLPYYSTKKRGSGLGLAIVRRIAAEHGGSIEVMENEPRGTKFVVELPS